MKISRAIGCIRRIKTFLTSKNLISLYYAMILPHIDYCCTSWGINSNTNLVRLQRLQNKYIRLIFGVNRYHSVSFYRNDLKWQLIEERIRYQCCILVYKILGGSIFARERSDQARGSVATERGEGVGGGGRGCVPSHDRELFHFST